MYVGLVMSMHANIASCCMMLVVQDRVLYPRG